MEMVGRGKARENEDASSTIRGEGAFSSISRPAKAVGLAMPLVKKPRIAIADGNEATRSALKELLLRKGFETIEFSEPTNVLGSFQQGTPDLVVIGSPRDDSGDALELAHQIRRKDRWLPLILIAAHGSEELAIAALRAGMNDYFKQPFSLEELAVSVERCLADVLLPPRAGRSGPTTSKVLH